MRFREIYIRISVAIFFFSLVVDLNSFDCSSGHFLYSNNSITQIKCTPSLVKFNRPLYLKGAIATDNFNVKYNTVDFTSVKSVPLHGAKKQIVLSLNDWINLYFNALKDLVVFKVKDFFVLCAQSYFSFRFFYLNMVHSLSHFVVLSYIFLWNRYLSFIKTNWKNGSGQSFLLTRRPFLKTVVICGSAPIFQNYLLG